MWNGKKLIIYGFVWLMLQKNASISPPDVLYRNFWNYLLFWYESVNIFKQ